MTDTVRQRNSSGVAFAILSLIFSIYLMACSIKGVIKVNEIAKTFVSDTSNITEEFVDSVLQVFVVYNAINIFVSFVLVIGVRLESHVVLLPWLIVNGLGLVVGSVGLIHILPNLSVYSLPRILYLIILLAIKRYFFSKILPLYREFKDANKTSNHVIE